MPTFSPEDLHGDASNGKSPQHGCDYKSLSKESFVNLKDSSRAIRDDLSEVLEEEIYFNSSFHFQKAYPDAPNPLLRLDGLGYIGLPLCELTAQAVINHCKQSTPRRGGDADKAILGTWELDGAKAHIDSPKWDAFIAQAVKEICVHLGISTGENQPRCQLQKLFISEPGSSFLPHQGSENANETFASMIVLLSSPFAGGEVQLSHCGKTITINSAPTSLSTTSVMSWFTGITQEFKPVQSGYRLGLSYDLIHTANTPAPSAPRASTITTHLQRIFQSWLQNLKEAPEKIVHLLQDNYSLADLKTEGLYGMDARIVGLLRSTGGSYGFQFGLGTIECETRGRAEGDDGPKRDRGWDSDDEDYEQPEPEDLDYAYPDKVERQVSITDLVDMDGKAFGATLRLHWTRDQEKDDDGGHKECIPFFLRDELEEGEPDSQEYDGYQDDYPGNLTRVYHRTVLVFWPLAHDTHVLGLNPQQAALRKIETSTSVTPSEKEAVIVEEVLVMAEKDEDFSLSVLRTLCSAATRWGQLDLWLRAFDLCHGSKSARRLEPSYFISAIEIFSSGVGAICARIEEALRNECSNSARFDLLDELEPDLIGEKLDEFQQWVSMQRKTFLTAMQPFIAEDTRYVIFAVYQAGIPSLLERVVFQVKATASTKDLLAFSKEIARDSLFFKSEEAIAIKRRTVADMLAQVIDKTDYFAAQPFQYSFRPKLSPDLAIQHMEECLKTDNADLTARIAEKLVVIAPLTAESTQVRATQVLIPILPRLRQLAQSHGVGVGAIQGFRIVYPRTILLMLDNSRSLSEEDITMIFEAADMSGDLKFVAESVIPKLKSHCTDRASIMRFLRRLRKRKTTSAIQDAGLPTISTMVEDLVKTLIQRAQKTEISVAIELMEFLYEIGYPGVCKEVLSRLLDEPRPVVAAFVSQVLIQSIKPMTAFMTRHRITSTASPFAPYLKKVVLGSVNVVLGRRPPDMTAAISSARMTCKCASCRKVVEFISSSQSPSMRLHRCGYQTVNHVTEEIWKCGASAVVECETLRITSPQSLEITKTDAVKKHLGWELHRNAIIQIVRSISTSETTLLQILGVEDYEEMLQVMEVNCINEVLPASQYAPLPTTATTSSVPTRFAQGVGGVSVFTASGTVLSEPQDGVAIHRPSALASSDSPLKDVCSPPRKKRRM